MKGNTDFDIVVVGGGIVGLASAYKIALNHPVCVPHRRASGYFTLNTYYARRAAGPYNDAGASISRLSKLHGGRRPRTRPGGNSRAG